MFGRISAKLRLTFIYALLVILFCTAMSPFVMVNTFLTLRDRMTGAGISLIFTIAFWAAQIDFVRAFHLRW